MNLESDFVITHPPEEVWTALLDVEEIAPCIPGFTLEEVDGDDFRGKMKVKVGAITIAYRATIRFSQRDDEAHRVVISASGKEIGGQGSVDATVTAHVGEAPEGTRIEMGTELAITGRVAQFGRGIISDVSDRLVKQFVKAFEAKLEAPAESDDDLGEEQSAAAPGASPPPIENEPLDIVGAAAWPLARRILPFAAALLALTLLLRFAKR